MDELIAEHGAKKISKLILEQLGPGIAQTISKMGFDSEAFVRYMPLSHKIKNARNLKGLGIKDVSRTLKIPQYKIKAIEEGPFSVKFEPADFKSYTSFLGLDPYVDEWCGNNQNLAKKLNIIEK